MTCHARPKNCNILSVLSIFKYNTGKTNNKFITSQEFLSEGKRRIIVYGLVTRYGPLPAQVVIKLNIKTAKVSTETVFAWQNSHKRETDENTEGPNVTNMKRKDEKNLVSFKFLTQSNPETRGGKKKMEFFEKP